MRGCTVLQAAVGCAALGCAHAGSISVGPTLVELSAAKHVASVKVQNTGPQQTIVQLETVAWTQTEGGDQYKASEELLATPTVFQLAPGESRDVRIGLRDAAPATAEKSFRLYVREVIATRAEASAQLSFAIRIGVPVFVHGVQSAGAALSWSAHGGAPDCQQIQLENAGGTRVHAVHLEFVADKEVLWHSTMPLYILAGTQRVLDPAWCLPAGGPAAGTLRLTTDQGTSIIPAASPNS